MLRYITEKDDNTKHSDTVGRETENRKTENDVREKRRGVRAETTAIFTFCKTAILHPQRIYNCKCKCAM